MKTLENRQHNTVIPDLSRGNKGNSMILGFLPGSTFESTESTEPEGKTQSRMHWSCWVEKTELRS